MKAAHRAQINRNNARNSTGPKSQNGKQNSAMNGFKHGLTGQRMILQDHEVDAYRRLGAALHADYQPENEIEKQLVQHIVDCNMRLNRSVAIDSNLLNAGLAENTAGTGNKATGNEATGNDHITETVLAQTRSWVIQADSFEKLGRYEGRISRQLLQYIRELANIQNLRKSLEIATEKHTEVNESKTDNSELASFRKTPSSDWLPRFMTAVSVASAAAGPPGETHAPSPAAAPANPGL